MTVMLNDAISGHLPMGWMRSTTESEDPDKIRVCVVCSCGWHPSGEFPRRMIDGQLGTGASSMVDVWASNAWGVHFSHIVPEKVR